MHSWEDFKEYRFQVTPAFDTSGPTATAAHSARDPAPDDAPMALVPDSLLPPHDHVLARLKASFSNGLDSVPGLAFPCEEAQARLPELEWRLAQIMACETVCHGQLAFLVYFLGPIVGSIYDAFGHERVRIEERIPTRKVSQVELAINVSDVQVTVSVDMERPNSLLRHGGAIARTIGGSVVHGLQQLQELYPESLAEHASAMAIKLALQMSQAQPRSRFGVFFAGYLFMLAELVPHPSTGGTVLITSPLFSSLSDDFHVDEKFAGFPATLPCASLPACFAALLCQGLPGFHIRDISHETDLRTLLKKITVDTGQSSSEGSSQELDKDGRNTSQHLQGSQNMEPNSGQLYTYMQESNGIYSLALGADMGNFILSTVPSKPAMTVAYDLPGYSKTPRFVVPVTFLPLSSTSSIPTSPTFPGPPPFTNRKNHPALPEIIKFLENLNITEEFKAPSFTMQKAALLAPPPDHIVLHEHVGEGRTGTVWRIACAQDGPQAGCDGLCVAKVFSRDELPAAMRETLFYEVILPLSENPLPAPKFYGTYASIDSGWYIMILEDVGAPVDGEGDFFPHEDKELGAEVGALEKVFENAGIQHGDIRPSNVLRSQDGSLRLIDFGYSRVIPARFT